jgi:hypothetical protein
MPDTSPSSRPAPKAWSSAQRDRYAQTLPVLERDIASPQHT